MIRTVVRELLIVCLCSDILSFIVQTLELVAHPNNLEFRSMGIGFALVMVVFTNFGLESLADDPKPPCTHLDTVTTPHQLLTGETVTLTVCAYCGTDPEGKN